MARTATDTLQDLAGFQAAGGGAISVYLDLDPSVTPEPRALQSRVRSAVHAAATARPDDASHEARISFDTALRRIEDALSAGDVRAGGRTRGLALFARGDDVFEQRRLGHGVPDRAVVGRRFALLPLAASATRSADVVLLLASRELGHAWLVRDGELAEVFRQHDSIENRHRQGGWAQDLLQRYTDMQAEKHLEEVAERLERVYEPLGRPPIVVAATEDNAAVVLDRLGQEARAGVIGRIAHVRDLDAGELVEQVERLLHERDCERERELLERYRAQVGRGESDDRSADAALAAISDGRVEWLLVSRAPTVEVFECPACGRLAGTAGPCPFDSTPMRRADEGIEAAVSRTLLAGGSVWQLVDVDRDDLDEGAGIGVITRF
jgi:hypothetical protein